VKSLAELLDASAALHRHLCPRQVLGARMGMLAGDLLGLDLPQTGKRLLTIAETDGCAADGISVATGCWVGRRTLRVEDYGKVAATFVDTRTGQAIRLSPQGDVRQRAWEFAPESLNSWKAQLLGYQRMPAGELLSTQTVRLTTPADQIIGCAGQRAVCEMCGEEILNQREVVHEGTTLCRACLGQSYYRLVMPLSRLPVSLNPCVSGRVAR